MRRVSRNNLHCIARKNLINAAPRMRRVSRNFQTILLIKLIFSRASHEARE